MQMIYTGTMRSFKKILISSFCVLIFATVPVLLAACGRDTGGQPQGIRLARTHHAILFNDMHQTYALPAVLGIGTGAEVTWTIYSMYDENGNAGYFAELLDGNRFRLIPIPNYEHARITFRATVKRDGMVTDELDFVVNVLDLKEFDVMLTLFSTNQTGSIYYRAQGIGNERVFGLWDNNPEYSFMQSGADVPRYVRSGDEMRLGWRYVGTPEFRFMILDGDDNVVAYTSTTDYSISDNVIRITPRESSFGEMTRQDLVEIDFLGDGVRTVVVQGRGKGTTEWTAEYRYTYDIRNAINAYTFNDVKMVEFHARLDYIINGVVARDGTVVIEPLSNPAAQLSQFWNGSRTGLLSDRFVQTVIPATGAGSIGGQSFVTRHFAEFERWAPAFRYRHQMGPDTVYGGLVLRDNMMTWAEATWFFGDVFGNGFQLNATPYSQNNARVYRNVFGMPWTGTGMEREIFRPGFGWGEKFAFYMASNFITIDNITLTGEEVVHPNRPTMLNDYRVMGVLGTAALGGNQRPWQIRRAVDEDGQPNIHFHNAGQRVQHSIIEKGLILIGVLYSANRNYPFVVDTNVLRYSGFAGVHTRGFTGGEGGGDLRRQSVVGMVDGVPERNPNYGEAGSSQRFGNFVVARNNLIYEMCTIPILLDDTTAGTYFIIEGESLKFYTWLRLVDLVFPAFKFPGMPMNDTTTVPGIANIARGIVRDAFLNPEMRTAQVIHGGSEWVNIYIITVAGGFANGWDFRNTSIESNMFHNIGMTVLDINLEMALHIPQPGGITVASQIELFEAGGLAEIIRNMHISNP